MVFGDINGCGGESIYGKYFEDEKKCVVHDRPGILGMCKEKYPHTNGSQFYITMRPMPDFDNKYVGFGEVICNKYNKIYLNRWNEKFKKNKQNSKQRFHISSTKHKNHRSWII